MRTVLVTLSGTHGTGKSTNAGKCYYLLNKQGLRFSYLRHQDLLDPLGFILRRAARILRFESTTDFERIAPVRVLSSAYYLFIYLPFLAGGIRIRKLLGYSTVADRYLYDLMAGSWGNGMKVPLEKLLLRMVPALTFPLSSMLTLREFSPIGRSTLSSTSSTRRRSTASFGAPL